MLSLPNDGRYPALELTPQQRRQRTLEALVLQGEALARSCPVLMVFEDAHWADPTSLELFGRVVDWVRTRSVLLIVTFRPDFEPPWIGGNACDASQPHPAGAPRSRRHYRSHRWQQSAAGEHTAGHHRAHGWHSPVRGRDDKGRAGGRERRRRTARRRLGSFPGIGGPRNLARIVDGAARPTRPRQGVGADRGSDRTRVLAFPAGCGRPQAGDGAANGA